ncbi:MAG: NusA antitermination factor [Candidatus Shapirobacteria bacterium GW2011_GWE1_38_10]|uniref:Transcription termination/antitermination protein NusA n=1 Tax=Candidatus Shapirobacteria bacterium GW2011_GWE1_38_10 TaxID=1618488 RepID=A0A0G0I5V6_9BACT|nr:MAG: NusA antitermination factor [Candidatus Shapirobacteria bacterium GW2011_GWF2_37_20]KKQ49952.1 MAG: NusA antitermination factor [Candidatus Shapirobacteria bacterium GW2011_GWE1_38_10]
MDIRRLPKTEFAAAVAQIAGERNIDPQEIIDAIEQGLISAYKRDQKEHGVIVPEETLFEVDLAPESGSFAIFEMDGEKRKNVTPPGFGRIAAMTAKQVIDQKIHEVERETIVTEYRQKIGTLVLGVILRIDPYKMSVGIGKTEGLFLKEEQIKNESLTVGTKKLFLIKGISEDENTGRKDIILSRRDPEFIEQLFVREVPEVGNHTVVIEKIAREAGQRTKVAVSSSQNGIDPVGSCIGQKGSRIQSVLGELPADEKVDVVAFAKNQTQFIMNALSPASEVKVISLKGNLAVVEVPEEQLALAIGSGGENVRLAGMLTDTDIKVGAAKSAKG